MGKLRYVPPNLVTLLSMTLGLASISFSLRGETTEAAWFILYSVLLDKLDGSLARLLKADSKIGVELDSFADFCAFGLAPAFLLFGAIGVSEPLGPLHLFGLAYVFGCVLRLARFNVTDTDLPGMFRGLASTHAGGLVGTSVVLLERHGYAVDAHPVTLGAVLAVLGVLMISPLYIPKIGSARTSFWKVITLANVLAAYVLVLARELPEYLFGLAASYLVIGSVVGYRCALREGGAAAARSELDATGG